MFQLDDKLVLSQSDLNNYLECEHLTYLDLAVAMKRLEIEPTRTDSSELVARKGDEYEREHLHALRSSGIELVEIDTGEGARDAERAATDTLTAMKAGADVIYQATFFDGRRLAYADFLERVAEPSELGDWSYEVADTKLARRVKPYFLLQLCFYSDLLAPLQGFRPQRMHVILGSRERESFEVDDFIYYFDHLRRHFYGEIEAMIATPGERSTYPHPVEHCDLCHWSEHCEQRREADDHLSLVARMARPQLVRLNEVGIDTVAALAEAGPEARPKRVGEGTYERLRAQARLQVSQRKSGEHSYELLQPEPDRGFALLPAPSKGDVFFDIEGDPFYEDGLEYLFGVTTIDTGKPEFRAFWGTDRAAEKTAFEGLVDFLIGRLDRWPEMHVYHYAHYEPTKLKHLMGLHATREDEVDRLLRSKVMADLYRVVEQGMRISQPSYSIKKVEAFYMGEREAEVTEGGDSIIKFEEWLESGDDTLLEEIERYNDEDCLSTYLLREWLLERRAEAAERFQEEIPWRALKEEKEPSEEIRAEIAALRDALLAGVPADVEERTADQRDRWLMAQLLEYHRREAKPAFWEYFDRHERSEEELVETDNESIGGLAPTGEEPVPLPPPKQSLLHPMRFPPQEHKIGPGEYEDPGTKKTVNVYAVDDEQGILEIQRSKGRLGEPLPSALIPGQPIPTTAQRKALQELAASVAELGPLGAGPWVAARAVLTRATPRSSAADPGGDLQAGGFALARAAALVAGLEQSYLFIQGPPGSGKTYTGAQLILELIRSGKRVGVCCTSHKAINKLLSEVEEFAKPSELSGLKKSGDDLGSHFESRFEPPMISNSTENSDFPTKLDLSAGTPWLWAREGMRADGPQVDYLFVDEAGQMSLADALVVSMAAENIVFLGDPLQLAQVSQGTHPKGSGVSVLEHLLGDEATIPPDRGLFIDQTRRMHPSICEFISKAVYDGRLSSVAECEGQGIACPDLPTAGLRYLPIEHEGNARQSPEEADAIATEIERLKGAAYTQFGGTERELRLDDIKVVTPYNAQVRCLRAKLPPEVQVGTVDKFQGQEAAVVFFSMATSSGAEIPRNVEFLFSRNRLNVAISRARCLAFLVASPELLTIRCRSAEQMRLLNSLCLLVEMANQVDANSWSHVVQG